MSLLDGVLVVLVCVAVLWGTYRQLLGTLLSLAGFYFALLVAGMLTSVLTGMYGVGTDIVRSLWGQAASIRLVEVGLFAILVLGVFVVLELVNRFVFPTPSLPKLGIWDGIFGGILGLVLGIALITVLSNVVHQAVLTSWQPINTWSMVRRAYETSFLAPLLKPVLQVLREFLFPFAFMGYPRALLP